MPDEQKPHCAALRAINSVLQLCQLTALGEAFNGVYSSAGNLSR